MTQSVRLIRRAYEDDSACIFCLFNAEKKMQAAFYKSKSSLHTATYQISDGGDGVRAMRPPARVSCPQEQSA